MSGPQKLLQNYTPDPKIRGLLGAPVPFGEIKTFLPNNPQVVSASQSTRYNPWAIMGNQSPQNISGSMDEEASSRNIENGIHMQFVARPHKDRKEWNIITGDAVFGLRSPTQSTGRITMLNLGTLNCVLRLGYQENYKRFKDIKQYDSECKDIEFLSESDLFGERWYDEWVDSYKHQLLGDITLDSSTDVTLASGKYNNNIILDAGSVGYSQSMNKKDKITERLNEKRSIKIIAACTNEVSEEIEVLLSMRRPQIVGSFSNIDTSILDNLIDQSLRVTKAYTDKRYAIYQKSKKFWLIKKDLMVEGLRFLYAGSIMDHWNFLGVVRSSSNDTGQANNLTNTNSGRGTAVGVTFTKKVYELTNVWGNNLSIGDKLWFVLTRIKNAKGDWGEFQLVPYSNGRNKPSIGERTYIDMSGKQAYAPVFYVGYLSESLDGKVAPQGKRTLAAGLSPNQTHKEAYIATCGLDKLTIHLRVGHGSY